MDKKNHAVDDRISKIMNDPYRVNQIIQSGINQELLKHKRNGNSICEWEDNKVVWIPPEKIRVNQEK
jgi:hypothetical protein